MFPIESRWQLFFSKLLAELDRLVKGDFICRYKRADGDLPDDAFGRKYDGPVVFKHENFSYRKLTSNICLPTKETDYIYRN